MALITTTIFREEDGTMNVPGVEGSLNTHCDNGTVQKKQFKEVFIYLDAGNVNWLESPVWNNALNGIRVALRVDNVCDGSYSYIDYPFNDFRLAQLCCPGIVCPEFTVTFSEDRPPAAYNISIIGEDNVGAAQTNNEGGLVQTFSLPPGNYWFYIQVLENLGRTDLVYAAGGQPLDYTVNIGSPSTLYNILDLDCGVQLLPGLG